MIQYNNFFNDIMLLTANNIVSLKLFLFIILILIFSIVIDVVFGELPVKIHPVVIIGNLTDIFKNIFIKIKNRFSGLLLFLVMLITTSLIVFLIYYISSFNVIIIFIVYSVLLSSTFSINMLLKTAIDVKNDLNESIDKARKSVSYLVSRSTDELTESFIVSAVIESLTENITDSFIAPVFYYFIISLIILYTEIDYKLYLLLLVPVLYRLCNTLDAMVGYKTDELRYIGYIPAKIDDILNYIPARIAGIYVIISAYILKMDWKNAYKIMKRDAGTCPSPNSGYTMASTAGALNIQLIKKETYILGDNNKDIIVDDIEKAVKLSKLTIILFTISIISLLILIQVIL